MSTSFFEPPYPIKFRANAWIFPAKQIMVPVVMSPALIVLFYADLKAKRLNVLEGPTSATSSGPAATIESRSPLQIFIKICSAIDAFGLILLGFSWTLILLPFTLSASASNGYKNRECLVSRITGSHIDECLTYSFAHCHVRCWRRFANCICGV